MSRWIDADALMNQWCDEMCKPKPNCEEDCAVYDYVRLAPSIDLVCCKECKKAHLTYDGDCKYCDEWKDDDDNYIEVYHDGNHYCSYGERRKSDE